MHFTVLACMEAAVGSKGAHANQSCRAGNKDLHMYAAVSYWKRAGWLLKEGAVTCHTYMRVGRVNGQVSRQTLKNPGRFTHAVGLDYPFYWIPPKSPSGATTALHAGTGACWDIAASA